jgi:trans-aconitate methyltransferase
VAQYLYSTVDAHDLELERLAAVAEFHRPGTVRAFDRVGDVRGFRCWDVGAGSGAVTRLLLERVGPTGSVLATDLGVGLLDWAASRGASASTSAPTTSSAIRRRRNGSIWFMRACC